MRTAPHPLTLRQAQYALAVAEAKSFRRAAERCAVSQPALSSQIQALEAGLGVRLFERDRRGVLTTPAGEALLPRMRRLLVEADDLVEAARSYADPEVGTLRLGIIPTISPYLLPEVSAALRERHPRLTIRWSEEKTPSLVELLTQGKLDGAVLARVSGLGDVESETLAVDPFVLAAPRGHPLARGRGPVRPGDLRGQAVLLLDEGHCFRDQALALCASSRAQEMSFRATSLATLAQMAAGGGGVTLLPRLSVATENRRDDLVIRRFEEPAPTRTIDLVFRRGTPLAPALRAVAASLRASWPPGPPVKPRSSGS